MDEPKFFAWDELDNMKTPMGLYQALKYLYTENNEIDEYKEEEDNRNEKC